MTTDALRKQVVEAIEDVLANSTALSFREDAEAALDAALDVLGEQQDAWYYKGLLSMLRAGKGSGE